MSRRYGKDWPERWLDFWLTDGFYDGPPLVVKIPWLLSAFAGLIVVGMAWFLVRLFVPRRWL